MSRRNLPSYRLHKPSGQAVVTLNGKDFYLGKYKSKASREEYEKIIAEYLANGKKLPPTRMNGVGISVEELMIKFLDWAESYYVKNGKTTDTFGFCRLSVDPVVLHYGMKSVSEFGPLSLKFIREKLIDSDLTRKQINKRISTIKQAFRWGVENELVTPDVLHALEAVVGLKAGRTAARDNPPVEPVADDIVEKTLPLLPPIIADMIQVQRLTGMRPGEVCNLRPCDIQTDSEIWVYRPHTYKTEHLGKPRILPIGPKVQKILIPYLLQREEEPDLYLFSPIDTLRLQRAEKRRTRKSKVQPSQICRAKTDPKRTPKSQYTARAYNRAIARACEKGGIESWSPNQLRHSAGTEVRDKFDLEHAQSFLGHSNMKTTEIYAKVNFEKAAQVAREIG